MELTAELETMKMEAGNGHDMAGNSLFGEVRVTVYVRHIYLSCKQSLPLPLLLSPSLPPSLLLTNIHTLSPCRWMTDGCKWRESMFLCK